MSDSNENKTQRTWVMLIRRGVAVVILLVVLLGFYLYLSRVDHAPVSQAASAPGDPLPVGTEIVARKNVAFRPKYLGQTEASQTVEIRARVRGFLLERAFGEGQRVEEGQLLFRIDPRSFQAELDMTQARLASAQARLDRAQQQVRRSEELLATQVATPDEFEEWQKEERVAAADVQMAEAQIAQARLDLDYTEIRSPISGVIGQSLRDVGSYVGEGDRALLAVVQKVDPIEVRYSISEQDMLRWQRMRDNDEIKIPAIDQIELEITLSDNRVFPHRGRISFIDVRVDPSTGTAVIRGRVPNPNGTLLPGQFVHVTLDGIERVNTVLVPQVAVMQSPAGASVYVVNERNIIEQRPLVLGDWSGDRWMVESGLVEGERIVIDHLMQLRPGMSVIPKPHVEETPSTIPSENAGQ